MKRYIISLWFILSLCLAFNESEYIIYNIVGLISLALFANYTRELKK